MTMEAALRKTLSKVMNDAIEVNQQVARVLLPAEVAAQVVNLLSWERIE